MKIITLTATILIAASVCYAKTPLISYDPNTVVESPTDPNTVTVTTTVEITKQQYAAMQYLGKNLYDAVAKSGLSRILDKWIVSATLLRTESYTFTELDAKLEQE